MEPNSDSASEVATDSEQSMEANNDLALEDQDSASDDSSCDSIPSSSRWHKTSDKSTTKEKPLDRISILHDSLLLHILSFLPARYAVRTCLVSKRWQFLWKFVAVIDFADVYNSHEYWYWPSMASLINHTLMQHQLTELKKFRLRFDFRKICTSYVDFWLRLVTRKNVEELKLVCQKRDISYYSGYGNEDAKIDCYVVPASVLNNSFLVSMELVQCDLVHPELINWKSLKVLSLCEMCLSNDLIREILCGSPLLEFLKFRDCWGFDFLDIKSERMRKLVVNGYYNPSDPSYDVSLKILAPNLKFLEISGFLNMKKLYFVDFLSLVDAQLKFWLPVRVGMNLEAAKNVQELLENLWHVGDLTVGDWCLRSLSRLEIKTVKLSVLKCLRVYTDLRKEEQSGIIRLLSSTQVLETLVMNIVCTSRILPDHECNGIKVEKYWKSLIKLVVPAMVQIKTVKFVDFTAQESEVQLILFLLKRAVGLEKMIIHPRRGQPAVDLKRSMEITQWILNAPRGSKNSVILLS